MIEIWKWVVVFVGRKRISYKGYYKVSNFGRLKRTCEFSISWKTGKNAMEQNRYYKRGIITLRGKGYQWVSLRVPGKQAKIFNVHRIVLETFVGPCPSRMESRHLNDIRSDNRWPENLCWGTHQLNMRDKVKNQRTARGEDNGSSVLTQKQVKSIRNLYKHFTRRELALKFGVSRSAIDHILDKTQWKWL